jgi:hypothetical protein
LLWPFKKRPQSDGAESCERPGAIPRAIVDKFNLDTGFYAKHLDYEGYAILSSAQVSDAALLEARFLLDNVFRDRGDLLRAIIDSGGRFMVMSPSEQTTDVPEQRHMDKEYWDKRARGLGNLLTSCGEENLLCLAGDRYPSENILIHEIAHPIHLHGLRIVDPSFDGRLAEAWAKAMASELWKGTYLTENRNEYWAEGVQAYFDCMRPQFGANTREKLAEYDPRLFALVDEVFKGSEFRYSRYSGPRVAKAKPGVADGSACLSEFSFDEDPDV